MTEIETGDEAPSSGTSAPEEPRDRRHLRLRRRYRRRRIGVAIGVLAAVGALLVLVPSLARPPALTAGTALSGALSTASSALGEGTEDPSPAATESTTTTAVPTTTVPPTTVPPTTVPPTTVPPTTVAPAPVPGITVGALTGGPGPIPVVHRVPTFDPVVFITIDDGVTQDPAALEVIRSRGVPVTQFLTRQYVSDEPTYFRELQGLGGVVATHTRSHPHLTRLDEASQRDQICGVADEYARLFGSPPELFRPPYGEYDALTVQVAASCGHRAVMHWSATFEAGQLSLQSGTTLRPGEVILMHFKDSLASDLNQLLDMIAAAGLRPANLADYIRSAPPAPPAA